MSDKIDTERGRQMAAMRKSKRGRCRVCSKRFDGLRRARFCSMKCKSQFHRDARKARKQSALVSRSVLSKETTK